MTTPAVSVVIPAYNAVAFIEKTLDSVKAQTFTDLEIIVVDDGGTDDTKGVVDAYLAKHKLAGQCIRQQNKRIAGARNTGMRAAKAPIIALLDHDDFWRADKLEKTMRVFKERPEVGLVGHHVVMVKDGKPVRVYRKGPAVPRMYERLLLVGNAVAPSGASFRKDAALSIGGFREDAQFNTVEDYDFWMRLSKVVPFYFIDEVLAEYTVVEGGASRKIEYHHANLEALLKDHFASHFQGRAGLVDRLRMRRRLSQVYRSALGALIEARAPRATQALYARKMLKTFPLDAKNLGRGLQYVLASFRSNGHA